MKQSLLILTMMTISLACSARADYEEKRELSLDARGIDTLRIEAGSGRLAIDGVAGAREISVVATIEVDDDEDDARKFIESDLVLTLEQDSDTARLKSYFDRQFWDYSRNAAVHLEVRVPDGMHLDVDDGSGPIMIENVRGDIRVEDGSGSIEMKEVGGNVEVDDGSGGISIEGVNGNLVIDDGSGSITVRRVAGSVTVDDGSGSIDVSDVAADLTIVDDGSGGLRYSNIAGRVQDDS